MGYALKRLQQVLRSRMDGALAQFGLTAPQYAVLALVADKPGISNAELARRAFVTAPTMIRIVSGLEAAGLLTRAPDRRGGRLLAAQLTAEGQRRQQQASRHVDALEQLLHGATEPAHRAVVLAWLNEAADRLQADRHRATTAGE
jgi:DNA-binding MarR family transcriptional regulator